MAFKAPHENIQPTPEPTSKGFRRLLDQTVRAVTDPTVGALIGGPMGFIPRNAAAVAKAKNELRILHQSPEELIAAGGDFHKVQDRVLKDLSAKANVMFGEGHIRPATEADFSRLNGYRGGLHDNEVWDFSPEGLAMGIREGENLSRNKALGSLAESQGSDMPQFTRRKRR